MCAVRTPFEGEGRDQSDASTGQETPKTACKSPEAGGEDGADPLLHSPLTS